MLKIKKILVALAGPITNVIIIFLSLKLRINVFEGFMILYANLLLVLFNLLPIYPLDGGRVIKNILHIILGLQNSYKYTNQISKITICLLTGICSIAILYIKNVALLLILGYLWYLVILENRKYNRKMQILNNIQKA